MPIYEYYCPACREKFEKLRSIAAADAPARCREGHEGARRLISMFAMGGRTTDQAVPAMSGGGGCCGGGGCACGGG